MCGIVAAVTTNRHNIISPLLQGLTRLEYRGYDSCGIAIHTPTELKRSRSTHRVAQLQGQVEKEGWMTHCGIAHTRWATHGVPAEGNAHPHFSFGPGKHTKPRIAIVHNGIIENYESLKAELKQQGYLFTSETDSEVITHLIDSFYRNDLFKALELAIQKLEGTYAIAAIHQNESQRLVGCCHGSPLVVGMGSESLGYFLASDAMALTHITQSIIYLEPSDVVDLTPQGYRITNLNGSQPHRPVQAIETYHHSASLEGYQHYMQKEIFEQPRAIADTLEGVTGITPELFSINPNQAGTDVTEDAFTIFKSVKNVQILACGTSYYSGCVAKYWLEAIAEIPTQVEIASEYRYRKSVATPDTLVITISQSGETADTLAALQHAQSLGLHQTLSICNVASSAMVRQCKLSYLSRAGPELGVASTKAFTTQLVGLFLVCLAITKAKQQLSPTEEKEHLQALRHLPVALRAILALEPQIIAWAQMFASKEHALFLGRGLHYPIAMEGALKLKEISYIHAEGYPAGELKHGPLALVTAAMPVVVVAPNNALVKKLKSNMQEVRARGGVLYVLADQGTTIKPQPHIHIIRLPEHYGLLSPILHTLPLQLLAYHTAVLRGTDVDKPRNLAKSVTVE